MQRLPLRVGGGTRVRFRVPPSRDKWPKRWTLGQKRGHLFRLPNGLAPFSVLLSHEFMPARHTTRGVRFRLRFDDLHHSFRYATPNAVRQFPLQDGIHRKTQVPDQQQMWDALALSLDSVSEQVRRQAGRLDDLLGTDVLQFGLGGIGRFRVAFGLWRMSHSAWDTLTISKDRRPVLCALAFELENVRLQQFSI